jgi:glycosyltransferase involved in cell wall biosynthesis
MKKNRILVGIPMFNCERQISRVLDQFDSSISSVIDEVLVVDNRSEDKSYENAKSHISSENLITTVLKNKLNYNLGGSHKTIFNYAIENCFDYVIILHGDDQANIHDLIPYIESGKYLEFDCMLGSRFMRQSNTSGYGIIRIWGNLIFNFIFSITTGMAIKDMGSGLNIFSINIIKEKDHSNASDDLTFNCYLLLNMIHKKRSMIFFPISWREHDQVSNAKLLKQAFKIIGILKSYTFHRSSFLQKNHSSFAKYEAEKR